jgi:hypothetical protein
MVVLCHLIPQRMRRDLITTFKAKKPNILIVTFTDSATPLSMVADAKVDAHIPEKFLPAVVSLLPQMAKS